MPALHLGVHEFPYAGVFTAMTPGMHRPGWVRPVRSKTLSKAQRAYGTGRDTGMVASILEAKYGIMQAWWDNRKQSVIIPAIEHSVKGALINIWNGQPGEVRLESAAILRLTEDFQDSLSMRKYDAWIGKPRVPTKAAEGAVSYRFKSGRNPKGERPSFVNTGLYQSSFVMWMDR